MRGFLLFLIITISVNYLSEIKKFLSESGFFLGVCGFSFAEVGEKNGDLENFLKLV